jgi:ATP-dependent Clp protease ATP-binding subunit ClpC
MPSSKDRQRIEIPSYFYERLAQIAETEDRTVTSVLNQFLLQGLSNYQPMWIPGKHLSRLNEHAQHVLTVAREEAQSFNHHYIGTEHILLGLLREQQGLAALVLSTLGLELDATRAIIERQMGRGKDASYSEAIDYVPRVRKVLSLAMDEAERQGCMLVRTEHILLGIVREGGGVAANILDHFGVLGKVRQHTFALLGQQSDASSS